MPPKKKFFKAQTYPGISTTLLRKAEEQDDVKTAFASSVTFSEL